MDTGSGTARTKRRGKRKRGRNRPRKGARNDRLKTRIHRLEQNLVTATQETFQEMFGHGTGRAKPFSLELKLSIQPGTTWTLGPEPSIEDQIRAAVQDMATRTEAYQPGRVYCYRCESSLCPHTLPPEPGSVFSRYSSTGVPLWVDLVQALLEMKHPDIDLLYRPHEKTLLAAYMSPELVKHRQLNVFGKQSQTYDILGQVVLGFLLLRAADPEKRQKERVALTLQAVGSRKADGSPRVELNVLGALSDGSQAMDALDGPFQGRVYNIISSARHRIRGLRPSPGPFKNGSSGHPRLNAAAQVTETLHKCVKALEKAGRQRERRTIHAEGHRVSHRPTSTALEDTLAAADHLFLWDEHRKTVVVVGPRNRVHVFSPEGRHITSLVLEGEAVKSRVRRNRWTQMSAPSLQRFRATLSGNPPTHSPHHRQDRAAKPRAEGLSRSGETGSKA